MIYINNGNIYALGHSFNTGFIRTIENNTGYLPVRICNDILLMSDGRLYRLYCGYGSTTLKLLRLGTKQKRKDYTVDSINFTDEFAEINSSGECYEIYRNTLQKIQIVANNCRNIYMIHKYEFIDSWDCYYYVNINNELIFFDPRYKSVQHLDDNVNSIFYFNSNDHLRYIIYEKNNIIIYSEIINLKKLVNNYTIDYIGQSIIKASGKFILDAHNNLYALIMVDKKFVTRKISDNVIDFCCDTFYVYITDTLNMIYRIDKHIYDKIYIDTGYFTKLFSNTKSANNIYKNP